MSSSVEEKLPRIESNIAMLNTNAKTASSGPARNSLPQGAVKCPIGKLNATLCAELLTAYSRYADNTPTVPIIQQDNFSGRRLRFGISGVIIAVIIIRNILMNGMLNANMSFMPTRPLLPLKSWPLCLPAVQSFLAKPRQCSECRSVRRAGESVPAQTP